MSLNILIKIMISVTTVITTVCLSVQEVLVREGGSSGAVRGHRAAPPAHGGRPSEEQGLPAARPVAGTAPMDCSATVNHDNL